MYTLLVHRVLSFVTTHRDSCKWQPNRGMFKRQNKSSKLLMEMRRYRVPVLVPSLILLFFVSAIIFGYSTRKPNSLSKLPEQNFSKLGIQFSPNVEFVNGTDVIWQIPHSPKAVLFLAHGCNGRAGNFWDKSPSCPSCVGLPEERLITLHALAHKFAVIAISSSGICWSFQEERLIVTRIIKWWVNKQGLYNLPLVALGASSGGHFVSVLATDLKFSSIVLMIIEGMFDRVKITRDYPPTLFLHMPKDQVREKKIAKYIGDLRNLGIDAAEEKCFEFPLSPDILSKRVLGLDQNTSRRLFEMFQNNRFIDSKGYMKNDGRQTPWIKAARKNRILLPKHLVKHIQEELNLAFSFHEMTSIQVEKVFDWFESHM